MAGGGGRKGDAAASAGGKKAKANAAAPSKDKENSGPLPSQPERPRRSATTEEARLAHMLGDDAGEIARWLTKNCKNPAALAKAKAAIASAAGQPDGNVTGKRNRPQMQPLFPDETSDEEGLEDDDAGGTKAAGRERSPELSGSEYKDDEDDEEETDGDDDDDLVEEDVARELGSEAEGQDHENSAGADGDADEDLADLLAAIPRKEGPRKKRKKDGNSGAIIPAPNKKGGKSRGNGRRTATADLVLGAATTETGFDLNLLLVSHLKMQQAQAEQLARNDRMEKSMLQLLNCFKKSRSAPSQQSPDPATSSATVTQQVGASEHQIGLLERLKADPKLLSSAKSTIKLLVSDAVNLSMLTSGVADSELMRSSTKLALRVGPDPEQEELFEELYEDFIQAHQMDKFRMKRGQAVSTIRGAGTKCYNLPATGTEDWSKITTELLAGDAYRKAGSDAYGDLRFRTVLAKACGVDVDHQPVPDQLIVTIARLAMVEVVLELQFRGIKRLEKQEAKMLQVREEALAGEPRVSAFVLVVAPEDPSVCPMRLQSRAAERARALAALGANEIGSSDQANDSGANPEQ